MSQQQGEGFFLQPLNDKRRLLEIMRGTGSMNVIYDCGSRDALDGLDLAIAAAAKELHIFECNPESFKLCQDNVARYAPANLRVFLNEVAIDETSGSVPFFPIDTARTVTAHPDGNPGASSLLRASGRYRRERYVQNSMTVASVTLNDYCRSHSAPDLLWLDLQGAEMRGIRGASHILDRVRIIALEVGFREMYEGQCMYWEVVQALRNFQVVDVDFGRWPRWPGLYSLLKFGPWVGNAVFVRT